jgi:hypothetical protein
MKDPHFEWGSSSTSSQLLFIKNRSLLEAYATERHTNRLTPLIRPLRGFAGALQTEF